MDNCRFDEGACSYCGKGKEGAYVTMDGDEVFLCKADFWRMLKLRSAARPREQATPPLDPMGNGHETARL
jgi:ribosomal protein L24E